MIDTSLEGALPVAFEKALNELRVVPPSNVDVVLVIAYFRSGSSLVGELLSSGPRTFFHFEPLHIFTRADRIRRGRERHAFQLVDELVRCRMQNVPLYTAWLERTQSYVHNTFLVKVATWIKRNTGIAHNVRVVHVVRDPRGIYASRRALDWCANNEECGSPEVLCSHMRQDIEDFRKLTAKLSSSRTVTVRFEDLVGDPYKEAKRLYSHLGLKYGHSVALYLQKHTVATKADMQNPYSTRRNASTVIDSWKGNLSAKIIGKIESVCGDVMRKLGYEPLQSGVTSGTQDLTEQATLPK
ncbi:carbohydrate sulfotransferase 1-like [Dermacentor andersoni]|uniref:carbohydrate sulfotransferase 1-like n=1 Tax=Dermacentor andersoni TaxID=34620 RepID=UPI0024165B28|nr:carbohydrate sulfotransferase 5-like [Dermacentor andersoni]